ncbi:MAG: histidine kinase [Proteobacteria bacterium]|nr:histidine kinase [Pseudomonadota bacterium]
MNSVGQTLDLNASLTDLLEGSAFSEVCESYYNLFDVPIRVFDKDGKLLAEVVRSHSPCRYINQFEAGRQQCTKTRLIIKNPTPEDSSIEHTDCVCGLRYIKAPILFQKEVAGKVVLGPYLPAELDTIPTEAVALDMQIDPGTLQQKLDNMRKISKTAVRKIMTALLSVIDVILFSAHKAHVTSQIHITSIRESYQELTEKNRELKAMNEQIHEFERLKSNFLATVSHELRTPLTSIIGYSDMLTEGIAGKLDEEQTQFVKTIKAKGDELLKLITSILDFSQIETGHLDLRWTSCDPKEVVESAIEEGRELAERRGNRLVLDIQTDLPAVCLDPEKIRTAVDHLVENAVKFSSPGGIIKISSRIVSPEEEDSPEDGLGFVLMTSPDMLEISVEDYGIGITEENQSEVFSPFIQVESSSTREYGGSGLGLAVVKHYVEAHGGQVTVKSRIDEGSKFTVRIPIVDRS